MLRQLLAATLCAVLALSACSSAAPLSSSTPSHIYDAETLSKTRVWGSNQKNLLHVRAVLPVSEKQHWGYEKCRWENVVGSVVTYDAFGKLLHQTGTTPNNYLFAGEQFDPDLGMYYTALATSTPAPVGSGPWTTMRLILRTHRLYTVIFTCRMIQ